MVYHPLLLIRHGKFFRRQYQVKSGDEALKEMKALIDFCKNTLEEEYMQKYNFEKKEILEDTIRLYDEKDYVALYQYVDDHIGWYWS